MEQVNNTKKIRIKLLILCLICSVLCGCNKESRVEFVTVDETGNPAGEPNTACHNLSKTKETEATKQEEEVLVASDSVQPMETVRNENEELVVHVCGAVHNPGVYSLKVESRVMDAVNAAGGMIEEADAECINLAAKVSDGDKVRILTKEEVNKLLDEGKQIDAITPSDTTITASSYQKGSKININTADEELLCSLPGIGATRAAAIIAYREEIGRFSCIEDIMNISGIKENSFQKIKEYITVD